MPPSKQSVLIVGATGYTGFVIAKALSQNASAFAVKALVRQSSLRKPQVADLEALGVQIISGDIAVDTLDTLEAHLEGVDTVISTIMPHLVDQRPLILAAKKVGIKRFIPSDFSTFAPRGIMSIQDMKLDIRDFIIRHSVPYTFIQLGWWSTLLLPYPRGKNGGPLVTEIQTQFHGPGDVKLAYTAKDRIGEFVERIIQDERTLNHTVQAWDGESTLGEAWKLAEEISGDHFDDYPRLSPEEIESRVDRNPLSTLVYEYSRSVFIRGDGSIANAIKNGALDARELYPDYQPTSLEESAKEFYQNPVKLDYAFLES
ncbi:hypothetical protein V5O48_018928 [Marasmius crinis-equi]|uniref:NmrA-like domain-containing protein n=1 Tax=Marasmius crinis-equi TaxID=585013 RepID=A0ABR3EJT2_9AGAR